MSARVSGDIDPGVAQTAALVAQDAPNAIAPIGVDSDDRFGGNALPNDHPHWMRDTLSISARARTLHRKTQTRRPSRHYGVGSSRALDLDCGPNAQRRRERLVSLRLSP